MILQGFKDSGVQGFKEKEIMVLLSHKIETFEECPILSKFKEGENFNRRNTSEYFEDSALASLRAEI